MMKPTGQPDTFIFPQFPDRQLQDQTGKEWPGYELLGSVEGPDNSYYLIVRRKDALVVLWAVFVPEWGAYALTIKHGFIAAEGVEIPELLLWGY